MTARRIAPSSTSIQSGSDVPSITPRFAITVFTRWWKVIVPIGLLVSAIGISVLVLQFEPRYRATALISIQRPPHIAFESGGSLTFVETQLQLMKTEVVLSPLLQEKAINEIPELREAKDPLPVLLSNLSLSQVGKSALYRVGYTSTSRTGAAQVCTKVIEKYLEQAEGHERRRYEAFLARLQEEKARREIVLNQRRAKLAELTRKRTGRDPWNGRVTDPEAALTSGPIGAVFKKLAENESRIAMLRMQIASYSEADLREAMDGGPNQELLDLKVSSASKVLRVQSEIEQMERQIRDLRFYHGEDYSRIVRLKAMIKEREAELERWEEEAREDILHRESVTRRVKLKELEAELARAASRKDELERKFQEEIASLQDSSDMQVEYIYAQGEVGLAQQVYNAISQREMALRVEEGRPQEVHVLHEAKVPTRPIGQLPYKQMVMLAGISLVLPYGGFFLYEFLRRKIYSADQIHRGLQLPMVGEVARLPRTVSGGARSRENRKTVVGMGIYAESIDILQTNLLLSGALRKNQILAVTSAVSGEGKTCVSVQLARSIARATGEPTLLVDGDLRAPDVADHLLLENEPGLIEVLSGESTLKEAIQETGYHRLQVLTSGVPRRHSGDLLRTLRFYELMEAIRERFAYVIMDTAPVLGASESMMMCNQSDVVLICCMLNHSAEGQVREAADRLAQAGVNVAGAMLNGTSQRAYTYKYGDYYYSHPENDNAYAEVEV